MKLLDFILLQISLGKLTIKNDTWYQYNIANTDVVVLSHIVHSSCGLHWNDELNCWGEWEDFVLNPNILVTDVHIDNWCTEAVRYLNGKWYVLEYLHSKKDFIVKEVI